MNSDSVLVRRLCQSAALLAAIRQTGSFTAAAECLDLQQSAVSHRVRVLERALDLRLFERTTRRVRPTAAGTLLCDAADATLAAWSRALSAVAARRSAGGLRLSVSSSVAMKWLLPILPRARDAGLDLTIDVSDELAELTAGDADAAIRFGRGPYPGLHSVHLARCALQAVASPAYLPRLGDLGDLLRHPEVRLLGDRRSESSDTGIGWAAYLQATGVEAMPAGQLFERTDLVLQAAASGNGLALGRTLLIEADLAAGFLRPVGPPVPVRAAYWLVCPPSSADSDGFVRLASWLKTEAGRTVAPGLRHPGATVAQR